ncbi:septum site-determining protein Ssd [Arthrobacter cryoconiti]|uniref:Septum site-determining protein Ssd n=1 Tax=Arthrobacter cryoconiti TaxID=748907 RepID=A0ABV8R1A6_9MICC|nr:septum site-determining protein Ssd [Arthrobacter cryoconiti]MCC9068033.1 hypothetical protein [Arthrobacter cryoconiti]
MTSRSNSRRSASAQIGNLGTDGPWLPASATAVLVITGSLALQSEVGRVAGAAAVELVIAETVEQSGGRWDGIAAILIGSDRSGTLPGWRGPTVVVGPPEDTAQMWRQATRLGADRVAVLPDSAQWLANYLTRLREPDVGGRVVGVIGGCGGAGATTLAALLAAASAARGTRSLLVDGDAWGGGLDSAVAGGDAPGLRWPDLFNASGAINPEQLAAALPKMGEMSLLSWAPTNVEASASRRDAAAATREVIRAARDAFGLVVVDLGRSSDSVANLGVHCDGFLLVVPGRLPAAVAAANVRSALPLAPVGLVVRGPLVEGVDAELVAAAVGVACVGVFPQLRKVGDMLEEGQLYEVAVGRKMRRMIDSVLAWMSGGAENIYAYGQAGVP